MIRVDAIIEHLPFYSGTAAGETTSSKIFFIARSVKGEFASPNCPYFPTKSADFGLNIVFRRKMQKTTFQEVMFPCPTMT